MDEGLFTRSHINSAFKNRDKTSEGRAYYDMCYAWICPEPINAEHVILSVEANRGLQKGNLHPLGTLLKSQLPLSPGIKSRISSMIDRTSDNGLVLDVKLDAKYGSSPKGGNKSPPPASAQSIALKKAAVCGHYRELERQGLVEKLGKMAGYSLTAEQFGLARDTVGDMVRAEKKKR